MKRAVYAGSFDPPTIGHLWMIEQGAKLFDELIVALGTNADKKYAFTEQERLAMLGKCTAHLSNVKVTFFVNQFLVNYARSAGATYILRGIRNESDYEYEKGMRYINSDLDPQITAIFLIPPRKIVEISSSLVKGLIGPEGWEKIIGKFVTPAVHQKLLEKFRDSTNEASLKNRWLALCMTIGATQDTEKIFAILSRLYSEKERAYHKFLHIEECLNELENTRALCMDPNTLEMAIWFHDAIYNPRLKNNEEQSAKLAYEATKTMGLSETFAQKVADLVRTTIHKAVPTDPDAQLLTDIDLSILGKLAAEFDEYEKKIRKEYSWVSEDQFRAGRTAILRSFLARPSIYATEYFRNKYEKQARENLARSLAKLSP
ncbi:MAG: pantetheine-phosphate adenylyltransferase [Candidatus Harrisonbacteria bacterium]|nr:pantetheine-phosphate adenylyltransferase [Candidatus Harrisonbacteria bacterium]